MGGKEYEKNPKKNNAQEMYGHKHKGEYNFTQYYRSSVKMESINKWSWDN